MTVQATRIKFAFGILILLGSAIAVWGQNLNGSLRGRVTDPSKAAVSGALVTVRNTGTGITQTFTTGPDGIYDFPNLLIGTYNLTIEAKGFRRYEQTGITINLDAHVTLDLSLVVGAPMQTVEVHANASRLNDESGVISHTVPTQTLLDLPLVVSGGQRNAAQFVELAPGVTTSAENNIKSPRFAGGPAWGDEAILDGGTMTEGLLNPAGMVALADYPLAPDAISEITVQTNNFDVQYGQSTGGVVTMETKSGTNQFHGDAFEFGRNSVLNADAWGATSKPYDNEHEFGGTLGGPFHVPGFWGPRHKTYFFVLLDGYRISGGATPTTTTLPTAQERAGNFGDWVSASTKALIPIYDPATTVANPNYNSSKAASATNAPWIRTAFPNNIIPANYPNFAYAQQWIQFLPANTTTGIASNYVSPPIPSSYGSHINESETRVDEYIGSRDHFMASVRYSGQSAPKHAQQACVLPLPICADDENVPYYNFQDRLNWDHTFSPTVINHFGMSYSDFSQAKYALDSPYVNKVGSVANVAAHYYPPEITFSSADGYSQFGNDVGLATNDLTRRPATVYNDVLSWSKGKHIIKMGGEVRFLELNDRDGSNLSGLFGFTDALTGAYSNSTTGNSFASFITGAAGSANVTFCSICSYYSRSHIFSGFIGDTWRITPKLTLTYGLRWEMSTPLHEKHDDISFFDPYQANTSAGGLLGTLAFAGKGWGSASYGANQPAPVWVRGFGPRFGFAYNAGHNTVVRGGYGIFYGSQFYDEGSLSTTGFSSAVAPPAGSASVSPSIWMSSSNCVTTGLAASYCGFPLALPAAGGYYEPPPFVSSTLQNGKAVSVYSNTSDALPYVQQFSFTIEHAITNNLLVTATYTGSKGTRLSAALTGYNVLNPSILSNTAIANNLKVAIPASATGSYDGVAIPYTGWQTALGGSDTVAQALQQYPQFTNEMFPANENDGNSFYNGFSITVDKRMSRGLWVLGSYNVQKNMGTFDDGGARGTDPGSFGNVSQYFRKDTWDPQLDDVPQNGKLAVVYDLPFDKFTSFGSTGIGREILGGWEVSTIYLANGGIPWQINVTCAVPAQLAIPCSPGLIKGVNPYLQNERHFDPNLNTTVKNSAPLLNIAAFEPSSEFTTNTYYGQGPLIQPTLRQPGWDNQDASIMKTLQIKERFKFQLRADLLDMWNWHSFTYTGSPNGGSKFTTSISSASFGEWSGSASSGPRVIVLSGKLIW